MAFLCVCLCVDVGRWAMLWSGYPTDDSERHRTEYCSHPRGAALLHASTGLTDMSLFYQSQDRFTAVTQNNDNHHTTLASVHFSDKRRVVVGHVQVPRPEYAAGLSQHDLIHGKVRLHPLFLPPQTAVCWPAVLCTATH